MDEPPTPPPSPEEPLPEPPLPGMSAGGPAGSRRPPAAATNRNGGWLVLAGGILVVVGVFLPWITVSGLGGSTSVTGLDGNEWGFLILGGFAIARGLSITRPDMFRFTLGTPLIGGVILVVLVVARWGDLQDILTTARANAGVTASLGIGIWSVIVGTACVVLGGLTLLRRPG
jgi:hypothetical protein